MIGKNNIWMLMPLADIMVNTELLTVMALILLMHDREWTAEALQDIVEGLRAKGYDFIDPATIQGVEIRITKKSSNAF